MQTRLLLLFLLAGSVKLFAQIGFNENIVVGDSYTTVRPQLVRAADIDGDNDLDVITFGTGLNWYENIDGMGNFGEKKVIETQTNGSVGTSLYIVDFDNDGDPDILGAISNKLIVYKNIDGLGNFEVMRVFTFGNSPIPTVPADIDADGDVDIVCFHTSNNRPKIVCFKNNGAGVFGEEQIISNDAVAIMGTTLLYAEDLDGDNDEDIIVGYHLNNKITWLKNTDGNGTYSSPVTISVLAGGITSIATSDIDNDGDMDIISASKNDNQVVLYKNLDGLGSFSDENIILSNAVGSNSVLITDINNDNTDDIVYSSTNEIGWLNNNGSGVFGSRQIITNKAFGVQFVITADIDGDGKNDIVSASQDDDKVAWYKHIDGNGTFDRQLVIARTIEIPNNVYPVDLDGDDDIDLLVNSQHDAKLTWFENVNGLGFYGKEHIITESTAVSNVTPFAYPVDIDGDGDLDIATVKNSVLFWYENVDGKGNFTAEHIINNNSSGVSVIRSEDFDGDGDMDLVCGSYTNKISWYKNLDSNGTFGPEQIIAPGGSNGSLTSLEVADMDGDNDIDIIASSYTTNIYFYKNTNGLGNFENQSMLIFNRMKAVYPADMDGDGDKDIIAINATGGGVVDAVVWYKNSGNGIFTTKHRISTLTIHGESIYAADIDNDGDMDVLTVAGHIQTSGQLAWYQNDGTGVFSARQMIHERFDYSTGLSVNVADVDHDNDMDVIATFGRSGNWALSKVFVFENLGTLGNTIHGKVLIDSDSNGCTNADIKGSNLMVISDNGNHSFATFTDQNGAYSLATTTGSFITSITSDLPNYFVSTPASHTFSFSGMNNTRLADFCVAPSGPKNDLDISLYPSINDPRPGFGTTYRIVIRNKGTITSSGTINFEYNNNKLSFLTASQPISSQTSNTLTFDFANLKPLETRTINLNFNVFSPPVTNINDRIVTNVTINPILGDETQEDNSFTLNQTVIGSYDPNDIMCLEGNEVHIEDADKYLHYLIRFQNTGNAKAINVKVENILDNKLDWASMQLESLSHKGRVEIKDGEVNFVFNNINLPDSTTDEPRSHGFIAYKVKPLNSVAVGDIVNNTADIYFDFNPPIVTNTASTQFVGALSVVESEVNKFKIYPNPTTSLLNIQGNTMIDKVSLIDINGRVLKEFHFNTPTLLAQLDLTDLAKGIYFLKIKSNQGNTSRKIIKG